MLWKNVWPACLLGIALAGLIGMPAPVSGRADDDDKEVQAKVAKLVEQLGDDAFATRNAASKALDEIGAPALDALREAMKSSDAEVRRRATALVATIEARTSTSRILTPKMVELKYKDTPLSEAIADFSKKSGYPLNLIDVDGKLKSKKITLDTGKVTFWEALEKFKVAAGLEEADPNTLAQPGRGGPAVDLPAIGAPGFGGGAAPGVPPAVLDRLKEAIKRRDEILKKRLKDAEKPDGDKPVDDSPVALIQDEKPIEGGAAPGAPGVAGGGAPGAVGGAEPGIAVDPVPPDAGGPDGGGWNPAMNFFQHGKINLVAAKPSKTPVDTRSSVRVRVMPPEVGRFMGIPAMPGKKTLTVMLQASPEPRLRWQQLLGVTIDKAIDEHDQKLTQAKPEVPMPGGGGAIIGGVVIGGPGVAMPFPGNDEIHSWSNDGINQNFPVRLMPGDKLSKTLKELSGTISARFLADAFAAIEVKDVMKAKGKTVRGAKGGSITINSVEKAADGTVTIQFEFDQPSDLIPEMQVEMPGGGGGFPGNPGIGIMPVPLPVPLPAPAPGVPGAVPDAAGGDDPVEGPAVEDKPAKPPVPPRRAIPRRAEPRAADAPAIAPAPAIAIAIAEEKPVPPPVQADEKPPIRIEIKPGVGGGVVGGGVVIGGGGAVIIGGPAVMPLPAPDGMGMAFAMNGLTLQDENGKNLPAAIQINWRKMAGAGGGFPGVGPGMKADYIAVYRPQKGMAKEPSKLVFTARGQTDVSIPFTLKDVPVK
jgi:hypothetical protein